MMVLNMVKILIAIFILFSCMPRAFSQGAQTLSDDDLDAVCAGGLNIDINAVVELLRGTFVHQTNIGVISGSSVFDAKTGNVNIAQFNGNPGEASLAQENITLILATGSDIDSATINNVNFAQIDSSSGQAALNQSSVSCMLAPAGNILNSVINNLNIATVSEAVINSEINQQCVNILVCRDGGLIDTRVNNANVVNSAAIPEGSISSKTSVIKSFNIADFEVIIGMNGSITLD